MMNEEMMKTLSDIRSEFELMSKYNDNAWDYQRFTAVDEVLRKLKESEKEINLLKQTAVETIDEKYRLNKILDAALAMLVGLELDTVCDKMHDCGDYCEQNCGFRTPQKECYMHYFETMEVKADGV